MDDPGDNSIGLAPAILDRAGRRIAQRLDDGEVADERRLFVEGLRQLEAGELIGATRTFRRAARRCPAPVAHLARLARGECERLRGNQGVALRQWRRVADDPNAAPSARYMAWLSLAAAARARDDAELLARAERAINQLESSEEV